MISCSTKFKKACVVSRSQIFIHFFWGGGIDFCDSFFLRTRYRDEIFFLFETPASSANTLNHSLLELIPLQQDSYNVDVITILQSWLEFFGKKDVHLQTVWFSVSFRIHLRLCHTKIPYPPTKLLQCHHPFLPESLYYIKTRNAICVR
jgi:hypothetical protein